MPHYSEMNFLFDDINNNKSISQQLNENGLSFVGQTNNIFKGAPVYTVFKKMENQSNPAIKNYIKNQIYDKERQGKNVYMKLLEDFESMGPGFKIKAADLAYLRDLGVYPLNRMVILRRFPEGVFVYENLEEMKHSPISNIIGWIKPDQNFGKVGFNETWTKTDKRFDVLLSELVQRNFNIPISTIAPIPDFAQGILFEFYSRMGLMDGGGINENISENYEEYDSSIHSNDGAPWGLNTIPVGNPNVLKEGPFRDPTSQNIQSTFDFELETTYEQKFIGDIDPSTALLDILENIYSMGTSNMEFYWGENSRTIKAAKKAAEEGANSIYAWWSFVKELLTSFWHALTELFKDLYNATKETVEKVTSSLTEDKEAVIDSLKGFLTTILTSTISLHRFQIRGSIELMSGGALSSTPWHLTLGNPYTPWLTTNHIVVKSAYIETSNELGFNDMPQKITARFNCELSRPLGKQELLRMFNNSFRRQYNNFTHDITVTGKMPTGKKAITPKYAWQEEGYGSHQELVDAMTKKHGSYENYLNTLP
jgi:hypothetical protein